MNGYRLCLASALLLTGAACAESPADPALTPDFAVLDRDGDGRMSEREWEASPAASSMSADVAAAHYRLYDVDENGQVSEQEYSEVNEQVMRSMQPDAI